MREKEQKFSGKHQNEETEDFVNAEQQENQKSEEADAGSKECHGQTDAQTEELKEELEDLEKEKQQLEQEKNDYISQLKRLQADFDNYKKRTAKEWERKSLEKSEELVNDILPVIDNFQRAIENADENEVDQNYHEGVKMIFEQLYEVLTKHGLEKIDAEGQKFDPNFHQAVMQVESEDHEKDTVVEELQPGFLFKGRLLRASVVKVSK